MMVCNHSWCILINKNDNFESLYLMKHFSFGLAAINVCPVLVPSELLLSTHLSTSERWTAEKCSHFYLKRKENFEYWDTMVCADLLSEDALSKFPPCPLSALASLIAGLLNCDKAQLFLFRPSCSEIYH